MVGQETEVDAHGLDEMGDSWYVGVRLEDATSSWKQDVAHSDEVYSIAAHAPCDGLCSDHSHGHDLGHIHDQSSCRRCIAFF